MPVWDVSEPYINLWLHDEPLGYQPGIGDRISFRISYQQRGAADVSPNLFSLGTNWNCTWLSYIENDGTGTNATLQLAGGGQVTFTNVDVVTKEYYTHTTLILVINGTYQTNYVRTFPSGARDYYQFVPQHVRLADGNTPVLLTGRVDPFGRTNIALAYTETPVGSSWVVRLASVTDLDGRSTTLSYTNANVSLVTGVTDPFGRSAFLRYDAQGRLTTIIDTLGLSSSFEYDAQNWITNLTTPYGTTTFEHLDNGFYSSVALPRAIRIIDAAGGTNVYMLTQGASYWIPSQPDVPGCTFDNNLNYRDSFHWGPRQAVNLPADLNSLNESPYPMLGRLRHWYHYDCGEGDLSQVLSAEEEPSPDGANYGQMTFYDYDPTNRPCYYMQGTSTLPACVARILPDGTTWYAKYLRDEWGRPTNVTDTYSSGFGVTPNTPSRRYVYDGVNPDLLQIIGPEGETLAGYAYTNHLIRYATNAVGDATSYTYDGQGRLTSIRTPAGLTRTNIYFSSGAYTNFVQSTIDLEIGRTNTFTYTNDLVYTLTDERGMITTNQYDALNRLTNSANALGSISYIYDRLDLVQVIDRMGFTNSYAYDAVRRRTGETNALGRVTVYNYCSCGALEYIQDAGSNITHFYYDNAGRRIQTMYADGTSLVYNYNLLGQVTNTIDGAGNSVTNWFNNHGLLYAVSNAYGQAKALVFDIEDRATNSVDINGVSVNMTYDNLGRMLSRSYPDNGGEHFGYSPVGMVAYTNQIGATNSYVYDLAGRKVAETNANGEATVYGYSAAGDLLSLTDGNHHTTTWMYDQFGRVTNKLDNLGTNLFHYAYDPNNRLTNRWTPAKGSTTYRYDALGNLTNIVYPTSSNISLAYDSLNRLTNMVDGVGTTRYAYDAVGQLLSEDGPWNDDTVSYTYANRLRASLSVLAPSSVWSQTYGYDAANRLYTIGSPAGTFTYAYTGMVAGASGSLVSTLTLPNGAYITNTFDPVARLYSTVLNHSGGTPINSHAYTYNQAGQRTQQGFTAGNYVDYTHDPAGQLRSAKGKEWGGVTNRLQEQFGYTYDAAGNLNWRTNNALVEAFQVNSLNELTTETNTGTLTVVGTTTGAATNITINALSAILYGDSTFAREGFALSPGNNSFTAIAHDSKGRSDTSSITVNLPGTNVFTYDLNGNLLSDGSRNFQYDDENQLTSVTLSNSWRSEFIYDGKLRRRIRREYNWVSGAWNLQAEVRYVYEGNLVIQERDSNNLPTVTYTRGRDLSGSLEGAGGIGGLLARTDNHLLTMGDPAANAYYHSDGNGNITCLNNSSQALIAKYLYDPFGNILSQSGPLADANLYRFSSEEFHPASGLVYYLYRYYAPSCQRWLNIDPIGELGGINQYDYLLNSPAYSIDPWGLALYGPYPGVIVYMPDVSQSDFNKGCDAYGACFDRCLARTLGLQTALGTGLGVGSLPSNAYSGGVDAANSSGASSPISSTLSKVCKDTKCPFRIPAPTWLNPMSKTTNIGRAAGRWAGWVGVALLLRDVYDLSRCQYECMVNLEL